MSATEDVTERIRLLDNESGRLHGDVQADGSADHEDEHVTNHTPLANEVSTRELLAVMAATWMGVFFSPHWVIMRLSCIPAKCLLSKRICRYHHHRYPHHTRII